MSKPRPSVEQFYAEIAGLNPLLSNFARLTGEYWPEKIIGELGLDKSGKDLYCDPAWAPLFITTCGFLKYIDHKPVLVEEYLIVFAVCRQTIHYDSDYYSQFFHYTHDSVGIINSINCRANCEKVKDTGKWCLRCHGSLQLNNLIKHVMRESMKFNDMSRYSILYIEKTDTVITDDSLETLARISRALVPEEDKVKQLQAKIDSVPKNIAQYIEMQLAEAAQYQKEMDEFLSVRAKSSKAFLERVADLNAKLKAAQDDHNAKLKAAELERDRASIQQICTDVDNRLAALEQKFAAKLAKHRTRLQEERDDLDKKLLQIDQLSLVKPQTSA